MTTRRAFFGYLLGGIGAVSGVVLWRTKLREKRADKGRRCDPEIIFHNNGVITLVDRETDAMTHYIPAPP